jgi:hypothetical protein
MLSSSNPVLTSARHEFCSGLIRSACPKGIPSGSAWLGAAIEIFNYLFYKIDVQVKLCTQAHLLN